MKSSSLGSEPTTPLLLILIVKENKIYGILKVNLCLLIFINFWLVFKLFEALTRGFPDCVQIWRLKSDLEYSVWIPVS
jgi:hypothetical protein